MVSPESLSTVYNGLHHQPSSRQLSRATVSRSGSRRSSAAIQSSTTSRNRGMPISRQYSPGDSSDDEVPEPKFSASVKALLDEDGLGSSPRLQNGGRERTPEEGRALAAAVASSQERRHSQSPRLESPRDRANGSPAPRVVRIGSALSNSRSRREGSVLSNSEQQEPEARHSPNDFITPAPRQRSVHISSSRGHTRSPASVSPSQRRSAEPGSGSDRGSAERLSEERKLR
ncbi:hypothetical protein LTS12_028263, partial [Elasticomyces elasticus]